MDERRDPPLVSVIVPVRNSPEQIKACLKSLQRTTYGNVEVIVVDDASTDVTPEVIVALGARSLRLVSNVGPAAARNRGAELARGDYLLFIDADVCVQPGTVDEFVATFERDPGIDAVFGSYDLQPAAPNLLSQYRNLFHHFVHQDGRVQSSTFWAGCGAIRRSVFGGVGGFDPHFTRPCIEDIELGVRLRKAGHRIELNKQIQVKHLKKWTLWGMLRADVRDRALPWTELILQQHHMPDDLNLRASQRVCTVLAFALLGVMTLGAWYQHGLLLLPFLGLLGLVMVDYWSTYDRIPTAFRVMAVLALLGVVGAVSFYFKMWSLVALALLLGIVLINLRFYRFFAQERHPLFAAVVVPLHVLYYVYCGAAFAAGVWLYVWRKRLPALGNRLFGHPTPGAEGAAK